MNLRNFLLALAIVVVVGASWAFAPSASALTAEEIRTQIKELLAKIAELTKQLNALTGEGAGTDAAGTDADHVSGAQKHRVCRVLYRNLAHGVSGDDVKSLQELLRDEGYFSADATGYFGELTREALKRWQAAQGIVSGGSAQTTGWGVLGPLTREHIKRWCGGDMSALKASPTSGPAPLTVAFWYVLGDRPPSDYSIDFGDGTTGVLEIGCGMLPNAAIAACPRALVTTHTYAANGTYRAVLSRTINPCGGNPACLAPVYQKTVGTVQVYVGEKACTKEYKPVCGAKPVVCVTTPCNPIPTTYSNRCMAEADGAMFLYEGQCRTTDDNRPPTISGFSGPTTLGVNQTGTWSVNASDPENGSLSYRVTWGDEQATLPHAAPLARDAFVQTTTFTHAYSTAGTYTITIVVRDSAGQEATMSTTVRVGSDVVACTLEYKPVCGQPPRPACLDTPPYCMIVEPGPTTYSNKCFMNAAGATFLYEGMCKTVPVACTQDAKQCPDGTYVGRTGPNCEFKCPSTPSSTIPQTYSQKCYSGIGTNLVEVACTADDFKPGTCTADTSQCPDGTGMVGRSGPRCIFVCPATQTTGASCASPFDRTAYPSNSLMNCCSIARPGEPLQSGCPTGGAICAVKQCQNGQWVPMPYTAHVDVDRGTVSCHMGQCTDGPYLVNSHPDSNCKSWGRMCYVCNRSQPGTGAGTCNVSDCLLDTQALTCYEYFSTSEAPRTSQLANVLTALEGALKTLLELLQR